MSITTTALCWRSLRCEGMGCSHCCRTAAGGPIGQRLGPAEMPDRSRCEARASPRRWKYNRSAGSPASAPPDHAPKPTVVISSPLEPSGRVGDVIRTTPGDRRLGNQQHLPRGLASFQQPVRLRRLRERELALDAHRQFSALDPAQHLACPPEQLGARRGIVRQRGPGEEQRALLAQHLRVERSHRSARLTVQDHHAPGREATETLLEGGLPDGIVDHLQPGPVRQTLHFSLEVLLGVQDNVVGAGPACQGGLLARRDRAEHSCAPEFGDLAEQEAHATRGGVHQACIPGLQGVGRGREVMRRHALEQHDGALLRAHAVRQHHEPVRRHHGVLGIRAEQARIRDPLPNFGCGHTGTNGAHTPRRFLSQRDRQRDFVVPCPLVDVDEVHAGSFDLYELLAGARGGPLDILVPQRVRTARRVYPNRFHPGLVYLEHMKISFIGLGSMGLPMARHLLQAGHTLTVYNRTRARADQLKQVNPVVADSPAAAVRDAEVLVTMVADDAALEDVMLGPDGALAALPRGAVHISMSTISPALSRRLAERHKTAGQTYVAAPVFGRPEAAEAKQLWIVAAGPPQALQRCGPVLDAMGQGVIVAGDDPPRANVIKLAGNFLLAAAIEAIGEAFALARKYGVAPGELLDIVNGRLFRSPIYENYGKLIAEERYEPAGFKLKYGLKDVRLALGAADDVAAPMPLASLIPDRYLSGRARGWGDIRLAGLARVAAADAGLNPPRSPG